VLVPSRNGFVGVAAGLLLLATAFHADAVEKVDPLIRAALANAIWAATFSRSKLYRVGVDEQAGHD
jgi:hypothetical protein